eukprot:m.248950 g.248950  ORF g.248950 m.248950 type:complete len:539 (-) comp15897_c0_seq1:183-1799(-)
MEADATWCAGRLARAMRAKEDAGTRDIARHLVGMTDRAELVAFLRDLIPRDTKAADALAEEIFVRTNSSRKRFEAPAGATVYMKSQDSEPPRAGKSPSKSAVSAPPGLSKLAPAAAGRPAAAAEENLPDPTVLPEGAPLPQPKPKRRFVNMITFEAGQAADVLPGRHKCDCQAVKHSLVNNCTSCGRVVCSQEGTGPCLFCGSLVVPPDLQEVIQRGSKKSEKVLQQVLKEANEASLTGRMYAQQHPGKSEALAKAEAQRDRLVEFDRTSARRTRVIDDESDYFASDTNRWLSDEDRKMIQAREQQHRQQIEDAHRRRVYTFDLANKTATLEQPDWAKLYELEDEPSCAAPVPSFDREPAAPITVTPFMPAPVAPRTAAAVPRPVAARSHRLQDDHLQELNDAGMCLSMHQPWATFLIRGLKIHEGRVWYTSHRGRLWIAAAAKEPDPEDVAAFEASVGPDHAPRSYPTACLLGCVNVVDCLSQEEYRRKFPDGESLSPFVLICEDPRELLVYFPVKGQHKIWKLEKAMHAAAKEGLR